MRELFRKVDEILSRIDFGDIWPGFARFPFALYDMENVYLANGTIPYDRRFLGNTAIQYQDGYLAIWNVEDEAADAEHLAAGLVHEMFHAYQMLNHETRYPNNLLMLNYPEDIPFLSIKHHENRVLANAYLAKDTDEKGRCLAEFISARLYREGLAGDIVMQEYLAETFEGIPEYVGSMALKQISPEKYAIIMNQYAEHLRSVARHFFEPRRMAYFTGAILCALLSDMGISFHHEIGSTEVPLFSLISAGHRAKKPSNVLGKDILSEEAKIHWAGKQQRISEFLRLHSEKTEGEFTICGYDPMNMTKLDNMILCDNFIFLQSENECDPRFIQGPVLVSMKNGSLNQVESYIR